jgi:hypothetical protein
MGSPPARSRAFSAAPDGPFSPLLGGCSLPILYVIIECMTGNAGSAKGHEK